MALQELWVEKYRPQTTSEYVFRDARLQQQVMSWIAAGSIPHILLCGTQGAGKSSLAGILINELQVQPGDVLRINASKDNNVDFIRNQIVGFASTVSMGDFKVIVLEEADYCSLPAQAVLRQVMEDYADTCRFILTGNYAHKIIPAIKSRCQEITLLALDRDAFLGRVANILLQEGLAMEDLDLAVIQGYVDDVYPDLRKCINNLQMNCLDGQLMPLADAGSGSTADWQIMAAELFISGQIMAARKIIIEQIQLDQYQDFFRLCYDNLAWWGETTEQQHRAIIKIRDGLVNHALVADPEINLSATLCELAEIRNTPA